MVLQRAPVGAAVWGYAFAVGDQVTVDIEQGGSYNTTAEQGTSSFYTKRTYCQAYRHLKKIIIIVYNCTVHVCLHDYLGSSGRPVWKVYLSPTVAGGPHVITASSGDCQITLSDVLFGDVWFCSGQSNMVQWVNNVSFVECISSVCTDISICGIHCP